MANASANMPGEHSGYRRGSTSLAEPYQQPDPLQQLLELLNQPQPDFTQLAKQQLDPAYQAQMAAIENAKGGAKKQSSYNDAQLAAMYKALGVDIGKNAGNINNIFNQGFGTVSSAYSQGAKDVGGAFDTTQNDMQAMLAKFGLEAAAPDALRQSNTNEALMRSIVAANRQSANNALGTSRAGDLAFNTAQQNIAGQQGTNARSELAQLLNKTLAGYEQQGLQAAGNYNSQLAKTTQEMQNSYLTQLQNQQNLAYSAYNNQLSQQQQAQESQTPSMSQQWSMMGPVDKGYYQASQLFGPQNAGAAMNLVMSVGNDAGSYPNGFAFVQAVKDANHELQKTNPGAALDDQQLMSLASFMYDQINPRYNPYSAQG